MTNLIPIAHELPAHPVQPFRPIEPERMHLRQLFGIILQRARLGADFILLSGEDMTALGFNAHGGQGCISVTANVAPKLSAQFQNACQQGHYALALELQDRLVHLHKNLFLENNPGGVKYAAARLGLCRNEFRLPLTPISAANEKAIDFALAHAGLLPN